MALITALECPQAVIGDLKAGLLPWVGRLDFQGRFVLEVLLLQELLPGLLQMVAESLGPIRFAAPGKSDPIKVVLVEPLLEEHSHSQVIKFVRVVAVIRIHPVTVFHIAEHGPHVLDDRVELEIQGQQQLEHLGADFQMIILGVEGAERLPGGWLQRVDGGLERMHQELFPQFLQRGGGLGITGAPDHAEHEKLGCVGVGETVPTLGSKEHAVASLVYVVGGR